MDNGYMSCTIRFASLFVKRRCPSQAKFLKSVKGEDLHRDTVNFRILGYSIFLAFVSVILAITLMKRYCECCYDDPKRTDDLNISYWLYKTVQKTMPRVNAKLNDRPTAINFNAKYMIHSSLIFIHNLQKHPSATPSVLPGIFTGNGFNQ